MKKFINKKSIIILSIFLIVVAVILIKISKKKEFKTQDDSKTNTNETISAENDINILKTKGENITLLTNELKVTNILNVSSSNAFEDLSKIYKVNDNANLYSTSKVKNDLKVGSILNKSNKEATSDQVYLVLRRSYPIVSLEEMGLETEEEAYQATQLALWEVFARTGERKETGLDTRIDSIKEDLEKNNIKINDKVFNKAKELVQYVEEYSNNNSKDNLEIVPVLMVDNSFVKLIRQPSEEENKFLVGPYKFYIKNGYFIDSDLKVSDENGNIVDAKYVDRRGNKLDKIGENTEFYLSFKELPEGVTYTLNLNAKIKRIHFEFYENNDKEYIANTYKIVDIPIELKINFLKPNTLGEIDITVYDENKNVKNGANIILYNDAKEVVVDEKTGSDGKITYYKVPKGDYILVEKDENGNEIKRKEIKVIAGETTEVEF